jgi:hypothetical protein
MREGLFYFLVGQFVGQFSEPLPAPGHLPGR